MTDIAQTIVEMAEIQKQRVESAMDKDLPATRSWLPYFVKKGGRKGSSSSTPSTFTIIPSDAVELLQRWKSTGDLKAVAPSSLEV